MMMKRKTQLYDYHKENGKLIEFSGFDMPVWYTGIIDEHMAVRNSAGLFDVSHMGRVMITGNSASDFVSHLLPTNCSKIRDGRAFYSVICNERGGIVDDVITNKFSSSKYSMVVNAANREKDLSWLKRLSQQFGATVEDYSSTSALFALQGPMSTAVLQRITNISLCGLKRFSFVECEVDGERCLVSRTGYTGEDGYEITVFDTSIDEPSKALKIWIKLLQLGKEASVRPCGLGSRDSLRLEAGMCLYGQDIDENTTPLEASLESTIDLDEREFVGRNVIEDQLRNGVKRKRVAFSMIGAGIPRHGCNVLFSGNNVGVVTSGTFSPILRKGIGMAYVPTLLSSIGQKLNIQIRSREKISEIVKVPFYDTTKYGYKRVNT